MTANLKNSQENREPQIIEEKIVKPNGDILIKRYAKGRFLGKGGFAKVYEFSTFDTKQTFAGKSISKSSLTRARARQKLMSEIKIHRSLFHKNIVRFEHFFEDPENVYILLEICSNQTLSELIRRRKRISELETQCYISQIISALKYLHAHRIIHRDIKLGNLFLSDKMEIKLGDFGLATKLEFEGERKRTICGTPNYIAPEILDSRQGHSYEVDTWSLGVLIYTLVIGKPPFETDDVKLTYKRIKMNVYSFPESLAVSDEFKELVSSVLVSDPCSRPSLDEILASRFMMKNPVPKLMPASTLAVPPSSSFLKKFEPGCEVKENTRVERPPRSASQTRVFDEVFRGKDKGKSTERDRTCSRAESCSKTSRFDSGTNGTASTSRKVASVSCYSYLKGGPKLWIKKWVDYSDKYGLGYVLSSGSAGVYFNDSTMIVAKPNGSCFQYVTRSGKQDNCVSYSMAAFPKELQKKVTLLLHFRKQLGVDSSFECGGEEMVYVKKWLATEHAIIFRLSNKVVQVNFLDKSELLLCSESKMVTFISKKGKTVIQPLGNAMDVRNSEMTKRLRYTRDILTNMLHPQNCDVKN